QKVVVRVDLHDEKGKKKAMKAVSRLSGLQSLSVELKDSKLTATGDIDPVDVVSKLRKHFHTDILLVEALKSDKKDDGGKKDDKDKKDPIAEYWKQFFQQSYYPPQIYQTYYRPPPHYYVSEEDQNPCVIF
ncbi:Heavy metal-associated domain, HMA, partial [Dillenia turbinata]